MTRRGFSQFFCVFWEGTADLTYIGCGDYGSSQSFRDIDGDGKQDVVSRDWESTGGSYLHLASALPFEATACRDALATWFQTGVDTFVDDLDGDGVPEFTGSANYVYSGATVLAGGEFRSDAAAWRLLNVWESLQGVLPDVQGDGEQDVFFADNSDYLSGYPPSSLDGVTPPGDPLWTLDGYGTAIKSDLAHADVDGDGLADLLLDEEIFLGASLAGGGVVVAADADILFEFDERDYITAVAFVGDLDGDGRADLGVPGGYEPYQSPAVVVSAAHRGTLTAADGFVSLAYRADVYVHALGSVPDLDDDGRDELVVSWHVVDIHDDDGNYAATYPSGTLSGSLLAEAESNRFWMRGAPGFLPGVDILGDDTPELVFSDGYSLQFIDGARLLP